MLRYIMKILSRYIQIVYILDSHTCVTTNTVKTCLECYNELKLNGIVK